MESKIKDYPKGALIFRQEEIGNTAYILTEGSIEIAIFEGKNKTVLDVLKPVSVFGEMSLLLNDQKRTATATALVPCKVAQISRQNFEDFFNQSPKLISAVLKAIVSRLKQANERVTTSPELYVVITNTIYLLAQHDRFNYIRYEQLVDCIADSYKASRREVARTVDFLETIGLIEIGIDGEKKNISIIRPIDFIDRAKAIYKTFARVGSTPDKGLD
jgi:CRP-like cAMP-binding protein